MPRRCSSVRLLVVKGQDLAVVSRVALFVEDRLERPSQVTRRELAPSLRANHLARQGQILYPVVDDERRVVGVITRGDLKRFAQDPPGSDGDRPLAELARQDPVVAYQDEPLRAVVHRMADSGLTRFPVLNNNTERKLAGMVSLSDLLRARTRSLEEERHRERVLRIRLPRAPLGTPDPRG